MSEKYLNPFDDLESEFVVLVNHKGQYSLWPDFKQTPLGWDSKFGPSAKKSCIEYIETNWQDIRS